MKKNFKLCILLLTIAFLICGCGKTTKTEETAEKQKDNHYLENKNLEVFDDTAIQKMLELPAVGEDAYYKQFQSEDAYEEKIDFEGIKADEPYQVRLRDADRYGDSCNLLIDVFIRSYMSAQEQQKYDPNEDYFQTTVEVLSSNLLAGDRNEFIMLVDFRKYVPEEEISWYRQEHSEWGQVVTTKDGTWLYGNWAIHGRMAKDYVFELTGVADGEQTLAAFYEKYPEYQSFYENIPDIQPTPLEVCRAKVENEKLLVTYDNGENWREVPISWELLSARGDERDGKLTSLQAGSYYVSEDLTIFLYGGSAAVPFSALVSTDGGKNFTKTVISDSMDVRAEFVSVPENSGVIYVLSTGGRTMSQEGNLLYKSTDGGKSFLPVEGIQDHIHSITTDFSFVTEQNGFVCVRSSEKPYMLVTGDGGSTWTEAVFENVPEHYGMAYAPVLEDGVYTLYVGEEAYSKEEGGKYRFVSLDEGRTWERQK